MLRYIDNFQQFGSTIAYLADGLYAQVDGCELVTDPDPTAGGTKVLHVRAVAGAGLIRKVLPATATTVGVMYRIYIPQLPTTTSLLIHPVRLRDMSNVDICSLRIETDGRISAYRGDPSSGTLLGTSSAPAVVTDAWQHIEIKSVIHASTGSIEVRVGGTTVLNLTNQNTGSANCTQLTIDTYNYPSSGTEFYVKDLAIWDGAAGIITDFIGRAFVFSSRPDGDVSGTWTITGGAGSAYASINETSPDDDTKYISSPWPAATADVCTLTDLPTDATVVKGVMTLVRSRTSDGGTGNLQVSMVSGASTGNGADRPITPAYTYWTDIFENDPATSAAWTVAAVNAAKIQFNRTA